MILKLKHKLSFPQKRYGAFKLKFQLNGLSWAILAPCIQSSDLARFTPIRACSRGGCHPGASRHGRRHRTSPPPSKVRKQSPTPDERSPQERGSPSPRDRRQANGSEYGGSPRGRSRSRSRSQSQSAIDDNGRDSPKDGSPVEENGQSRNPSPIAEDDRSPVDDDDNHGSPRGSESA
ncbi:hypothetical protein F0562_022078 [Nyssa sinensis]|uniref:Uncharacterized protein n=1 Tax=Nyssa sinensis TaxID=561372 RepID=A0A5J5BKT2_9ASTE|nr:hypothetical protein F0562_022078 [Nyssa sinensis]